MYLPAEEAVVHKQAYNLGNREHQITVDNNSNKLYSSDCGRRIYDVIIIWGHWVDPQTVDFYTVDLYLILQPDHDDNIRK